jgi:hypothetical protein
MAVAIAVTTGLGSAGRAAGAPVAVPPPTITSPAGGSTVTVLTPRLAGGGLPGDEIIVSEAGFIRCVATVTAAGRWACTSNSPFNDGVHHLTATQTDRAGVMSGNSSTLNLQVRAVARGAPRTSVPSSHAKPAPRNSTAPRRSPSSSHGAGASARSGSGTSRNVPLAIGAVLALATVALTAAYLRLGPRRQR